MRARCPGIIRFVVVLAVLCLNLPAAGLANARQFEEANRLYEQGRYSEAISQYRSLLESGRESANLLFNLGNACFKSGEVGRAIYYYRRAEALAPRDPDIQANLRFARDRISGGASIQIAPWEKIVGYVSVNEMASVAAGFFWICLGLLGWMQYRPKARPVLRSYTITAGALLLLSLVLLGLRYASVRQRIAIVIEPQVDIRLGPLAESQVAFSVPDGTELMLENRRENWVQVIDRSGRSGWVELEKVATLPDLNR